MSRLLDRIKDIMQGRSHEQNLEPVAAAREHRNEPEQAAPETAEHASEHDHGKDGHRHC